MQKLRARVALPGDAFALRRRLEAEFLNRNRLFVLRIALADFGIPGDVVLGKEVLVHARLVLDGVGLSNHLQVDFMPVTGSNLFPTFRGTLDVYPAEHGAETILELLGSYAPPLGILGLAIDTTFGYLIAERAMTDFLRQVALELKVRVQQDASAAV